MTTETSFNPGDVEPAKVNLIEEPNVQDEHLDESTPALGTDTQPGQAAPEPNQPVHAEPKDSDERYRNLQAAYTKVTQENGELRNRLDQIETRLAQPTPQQQFVQPAPATPAAPDPLDTVTDEFPELEPIASRMKNMQTRMDAQEATQTAQQKSMDTSDQQTAQAAHEQRILNNHADAFRLMNSVDFQGWLARQPSYMQRLMQKGNSREISDLFTAYKATTGNTQEQQKLDEARIAGAPELSGAPILNTNDSNKRMWTNAEIGALTDAEYIKLEVELDLAAREGRIIG